MLVSGSCLDSRFFEIGIAIELVDSSLIQFDTALHSCYYSAKYIINDFESEE